MKINQRPVRSPVVAALSSFLTLMAIALSSHAAATWQIEPSLKTARNQFAGGVIDGKIYVFGGNRYPDELQQKSTEMFDPSQAPGSWVYKANNEHAGGGGVEEVSAAAMNGKLYVFGAFSEYYDNINFVEEYDPAANSWVSKAPMPTLRTEPVAVTYSNKIYVFGGGGRDFTTNVVEAYDPANNTWQSVTHMPRMLDDFTVAVVADKAYVIGGIDYLANQIVDTVSVYNFTTKTWTTNFAKLPAPKVFYRSGAPVLNGKIYLISNVAGTTLDNLQVSSSLVIYDPVLNTWQTGLPCPTPTFGLSVIANQKLYVIGGDDASSGIDNPVITANVWSLDLSVTVAPTITTTSPLPAGTVGSAYSQTLTADGGTTPYTWAVASNNLPSGLSLSSDGVISGTPNQATLSNNFSVKVTGNNGLSSTNGFSLTINFAPVPFTYTTNNGAITITKYTCSGGAVTIPDTINGYPVTSIGIGAFSYCTSLTSIMIPNSVTSIGIGAFFSCTNLTSITIPTSVTSIGYQAFSWCTSLSAITVDTNNPAYGSVDGVLFNKNLTTLIQYPGGKIGSYSIPTNVTSIGSSAFSSCTSLTSITIPTNVTNIGDYAFGGCTSLTSITIPNSVTNIGDYAFGGCTSLTGITVAGLNSFYSSTYGVLFNKGQTTLIAYPGGKAGVYTIPNSVTSIGDLAFWHCTNLTSITIPNSVTSIGGSAFGSCASLTSVTIPNSVTKIGDYAFWYCDSLKGVYFHGNAPSVGGTNAFSYATNVTVYYLPGTTGWTNPWQGCPTVYWYLPNPVILGNNASFGVQTNDFGFTISWATNISVVVEASTNLTSDIWIPVVTNSLINGTSYFTDPQWTNYPGRFYRVRTP